MPKQKYEFELPYKYNIIGIQPNRNNPKRTDSKTNEVIDDGKPHHLLLGGSNLQSVAEFLMGNLKKTANESTHLWEMHIEET